jgi:hypothetical protein
MSDGGAWPQEGGVENAVKVARHGGWDGMGKIPSGRG